MPEQPQSTDHGFTMVEMLVSILLLTIVMAGTLALQLSAIRSSSTSRMTSSAMTLAQSRLEEFRGARILDLMAAPPAVDIDCFGAQGEPLTACSAQVFTRTTQHVVTGIGLRADVTVQWMTRTGTQQLAVSMERSP